MKYVISFLFILAIVISCNTPDKKSKLLSTPDNLITEEVSIPVDKDTTILTENGAVLNFPKGALTTGSGSRVTLEIKEAYSIQQMIQAGLTTQSDGQPLSSGGMIYINAKGGQNVKITQAIRVAIPADYLDKNMQLFKGEKDADGNINWTEPKPLPGNKQLSSIDQGQVFFQAKCASCHAIGKDGTGPDLAHFPKRIPYGEGTSKYWYHYFRQFYTPYSIDDATHKVDSIYEHRWVDPYACNLINMYGSYGPPFDTTWPVMKSVYDYIQNESNRRDLPLPSHAYLKDCTDSCELYTDRIKELKYKKANAENVRNHLIKDNGRLTEEKHSPGPPPPGETISPPPVEDYDNAVSPENNGAVYYQFTIESFGWYNIDVLMKGVDGNEKSELRVRIIGQYREKLDIFLIIPGMNAFVKGGPTEQREGEYAFGYKDGTLYIPQNTTAYIMAYKETSSSIAFAMKEFTTTTQQNFEIALEESTVEVFNKAVSNIGNGRIKIDVHDSKNADEIRKTDTDIKNIDQLIKDAEKLKPQRCDCDCGLKKDSTQTAPAPQ